MTPRTLLAYLFGSRSAIQQIAATPKAIWLGALFVGSAIFAREYDSSELSGEPWRAALPVAAPLATSFRLYLLVYLVGLFRGVAQERFWRTYITFLSLYWMTAPLAWLYAIPVC